LVIFFPCRSIPSNFSANTSMVSVILVIIQKSLQILMLNFLYKCRKNIIF
jgi:hypothetical protein